MDLSYKEKPDKLQVRIRAHKEFANFDVAEWIDGFLSRRPRRAILDLGCGNGNHLGLYLEHVGGSGRVAGLDREARLIEEARRRHERDSRLDLRLGSMDERLPWADGAFDTCFSNFAIYNAANPRRTLEEMKRVMAPGADIVLIGPTRKNALELYEFNRRLTGVAIDEITLIRTDRLRQEILPLVKDVFGAAEEEVLHSRLTFPSPDEFLLYFQSTMLYEEGAEKKGVTREQMRAALQGEERPVVSKEMLAVIARRAG